MRLCTIQLCVELWLNINFTRHLSIIAERSLMLCKAQPPAKCTWCVHTYCITVQNLKYSGICLASVFKRRWNIVEWLGEKSATDIPLKVNTYFCNFEKEKVWIVRDSENCFAPTFALVYCAFCLFFNFVCHFKLNRCINAQQNSLPIQFSHAPVEWTLCWHYLSHTIACNGIYEYYKLLLDWNVLLWKLRYRLGTVKRHDPSGLT